MSKPLSFYGQINYTRLKNALKEGKVKAEWVETKNGKELMVNVNFWVKEEADQYNNNAALQLQNKPEFQEEYGAYVGNFKYKVPKTQEASQDSINHLVGDDDDLPY